MTPIPNLTVEELLASPTSYSHTMVKVRGCFVTGFEKVVLQPCGRKNHSEQIWVENAFIFQEMKRLSLPGITDTTPNELKSPALKISAKGKLLFRYDEKRNSQAWNKLEASPGWDPMASQVLLLGQFETISPRVPMNMELGFGHLNAYTSELILVDVLTINPATAQ